ncbi:MAG: hypothetical protein RBG13Loki_2710 [Promethearchaeota archaeon CR_4]|nr:MAG: hypothetical protein RBG13Loki_2710 [Candidatus Lokiarchaeota archaeon CR_4]
MNKKAIAFFIIVPSLALIFYSYYNIVSQEFPPDPIIFILIYLFACFLVTFPLFTIWRMWEKRKLAQKNEEPFPIPQQKVTHDIVRNCPSCGLLVPGHLTKCPICGFTF